MLSSDEEDNDDYSTINKSSSSSTSAAAAARITSSILFGNIDENGQLTDDIFDDLDCKQQLDSLQPHLSSIISYKELIDNDNDDDKEDKQENNEDDNFGKKLDDAIDYSDINEFAADEEKLFVNDLMKNLNTDNDNYDDDDGDDENKDKQQQQQQNNEFQKDKDGFVIPQQPVVVRKLNESIKLNNNNDEKIIKSNNEENNQQQQQKTKKPLDTPLAAMLPSKYANLDVTELFPTFRHDKVLRFSKLFGAGKSSSLPQKWKSVRNKRRNRHIIENKIFIVQQSPSLMDLNDIWKFNSCSVEDIPKDMIEIDDEILLLQNNFIDNNNNNNDNTDNSNLNSNNNNNRNKIAEWRYGPAKFWYDRMNVPENGEGFDYGFKLKIDDDDDDNNNDKNNNNINNDDDDDSFHLVNQFPWENEVIWNSEKVRDKILAKLNDKNLASGWLPSGYNRTATAFTQQIRGGTSNTSSSTNTTSTSATKSSTTSSSLKKNENKKNSSDIGNNDDNNNNSNNNNNNGNDQWYSIFPIENEDLVYGIWEDSIIWDSEQMNKIPEPPLLVLDRNDENIILEVPNDEDLNELNRSQPTKEKKEGGIRKSRLLLGKAGVIAEPEILQPPSPPSSEKDPFNISNDEYYAQKTTPTELKTNVGHNLIQHSIPALELRQPFFPTFLSYQRLRAFHRPSLKRYSHGAIADTLPHGVQPLVKHIKRKAKQREQERQASGGGEMFFMRTPEDLTGKDGDLILAEYSEEHPPLIMQVGMATKIKNYYRRKLGKDCGAPNYKYGETIYCHTSPFLGNLQHGQSIQALENNLFRVPIYEHQMPETDFLVIRTRDNYYIREIETIYTVGQELPLYEVPGPNSKKANIFMRDFLEVFIHRLFWKNNDNPRRIRMEDIKKAFPLHSESSIRKRLKQCADFKRTGMDSNWWVLKSDFRLPSEDEIRAKVSPEACCAYYSMLAAEQRLKDAGYGEKSIVAPDDAEDEDLQMKMEDEIKAAPWNTTRAFIAAMKGKCLLQLTGVADPTGCGEGFSYVRIPNKPQQSKEEQQKEPLPKKTVTGTDADLRRLPLNAAKQLLRKFGVPDDEIKKLSRWEVIDVVRTLSTKQVKQQTGDGNNGGAGEDDAMSKFARGNRFSIAEHQERYKEECQRIFDLQNRVLASNEDLSTDEDESEDDEDSEIEELGKNIESMLANKKTINQISRDREEQERKELKKLMFRDETSKRKNNDNDDNDNKDDQQQQQQQQSSSSSNGKILKIYRTYQDNDGKEYVRIETVRKPAIIDTYVRIRTTKDEAFIRQFASAMDDQQKEEKRKEKRRIQEQLRRMKRNQEREKFGNSFRNSFGMTPLNINSSSQQQQQMIQTTTATSTAAAAATTTLSTSTMTSFTSFNQSLSNLTTTTTSTPPSPFIYNQNNSSSSLVTTPTTNIQTMTTSTSSSLSSKNQKSNRKENKDSKLKCGACGGTGHMRTNRACPLYSDGLSNDGINQTQSSLNDENLVKLDETKLVLSKSVMKQFDLEQQLEKQQQKKSLLKLKIPKELLMMKKRKKRLQQQQQQQQTNDEYLQRPDYQKSANRCRTDPLIIISDVFEEIWNEMRTMTDSEPFHQPVNIKTVPDYYNIIKNPMDLQTIRQNIREKRYKNREEFLNDVNLIVKNSEIYNGTNHILTLIARRLMELCIVCLEKKEDELIKLEKIINPLLDEDQIAFSYILKTIVEKKLKTIPDTWSFHKPVNNKKIKNYYDVIKNPMDLDTIESNASNHQYCTREAFLKHVTLIYENSVRFNGMESELTKKAAQIVDVAINELKQYETQLIKFEKNISNNNNIVDLNDNDNDNDFDDDMMMMMDDESNMAEEIDDLDEPPNKQPRLMTTDDDVVTQQQQQDIVADDLQMESGDEDESHNDNNDEPIYQQQQQQNVDDFDENYDPSEFLLKSSFAQQSSLYQQQQQQQQQSSDSIINYNNDNTNDNNEPIVDVSQDLDVSDSDDDDDDDDDNDNDNDDNIDDDDDDDDDDPTINDADDGDDLWF